MKAVVLFRLYMGHDCLAFDLHRLNVFLTLNCTFCNTENYVDIKLATGTRDQDTE